MYQKMSISSTAIFIKSYSFGILKIKWKNINFFGLTVWAKWYVDLSFTVGLEAIVLITLSAISDKNIKIILL